MGETIFRDISGLFDRFMANLGDWVSQHALHIITILIFAWLLGHFGGRILGTVLKATVRADLYPTVGDRTKRIKTLDSLASAILRAAVYLIAGLMLVTEIGVNTGPLVASAGILGIALGFGAQSLIKDLTSGIFIIIDNQYRVGDIVELDKVKGKVEAITIRTTVVRGLDGTLYHVPNGSISWTANKTMSYGGFEEDIVFPSDTDIEKLSLIIDRVGKTMSQDPNFEKKIKYAPHFERVVGFDPAGIKVKVLGRTAAADTWEVKGEFYKRLITALRKAKIDIAPNQITIARQPKKEA